jgi:hypothetical protein
MTTKNKQHLQGLLQHLLHQQVSHFKTLPKVKGDIIFIGNSITEGAEWSALLGDNRIKNRGFSDVEVNE